MEPAFFEIGGGITAPKGFRASAVCSGIKEGPLDKDDLGLVISDFPAVAAATFTSNKIKAAPVRVSADHLRAGDTRAIIANSGNANACTGSTGIQNAKRMARGDHAGFLVQPGDTWELYVGADKRIEEIVYRRGAANLPHLVSATYVDYKKAGPLLISTDHRGTEDGKPLHVWISDVSVKLTGSEKWINAQ